MTSLAWVSAAGLAGLPDFDRAPSKLGRGLLTGSEVPARPSLRAAALGSSDAATTEARPESSGGAWQQTLACWLPAVGAVAMQARRRRDAHDRKRWKLQNALRRSGQWAGRLARNATSALAEPAEAPAAQGIRWAKWSTFWACFFGYTVCYFTRQSLSYTAPFLKTAMGWEGLAEIGQLSSLFPLAYGSSRFLGGVLGDRMSPSKVFCLGCVICGSLNIAFGLSSSLPWFAGIWLLNGCFQGLAAPPCVKMITNWFDPSERGFWWSIWHASINLGGFLIPFLAGGLAERFGWRWGMFGPGCLALVAAAICAAAMQDGPATKDEAEPVSEALPEKVVEEETVVASEEKPAKTGLVQGLLSNPRQWVLGLAYLLVYVCRQGLGIWGVFFLLHSGAPSAAKAAALFSGMELGGFFGNFTCGSLSDYMLKRARPGQGEAGQRVKVVVGCFFCILLLLPLLARCPSSMPWVQYVLLFGLGHFLSGAQLLLPLIAAEVAPKQLTSTATGFIGWVGYFGAAMSGLPLSRIVTDYGWSSYWTVLSCAAGGGVVLLAAFTNMKSSRQLEAAKAA